MAISDWMRFQLAYGFGTVRAAKALESGTRLPFYFTPRTGGCGSMAWARRNCAGVREAKDADLGKILGFCERNGVKILTPDDDLYPQRLRNIQPAGGAVCGRQLDGFE